MMSMEYRLSIAVCCHADTPFFDEMMESFVLADICWPKTEMLICDDGSPAGGDGDRARQWASREDLPFDMKVIRHEHHWYQPASEQQLCQLAQGEYILFFDSDDVLMPFDVQGALDFLDAHPEYCGSYGKKVYFDGEHGLQGCIQGGDYSAFEMLIVPPLAINGMIVRSEDLRKSWGFLLPDGRVLVCGNDICMWLGCAIHKDFYFDGQFRAMYRIHSSQVTQEGQRQYAESYRILREQIRLISKDLLEKIYDGQRMAIPESRRKELMILLGAELAETTDVGKALQLTNIALQVDPDDYGVREMRFRLLRQEKRVDEIILEAFLMREEHPESLYIAQLAFRQAMEVLEESGKESEPFRRLCEKASGQYFKMTEQQQKIANQVVEHARRLHASGIR